MDQNTSIEQAAAHFRTLLTEQLNRQERMAQGSPAKDFSRMERIVIGLIPGDGIGPILMAQARRVLEKLLADGRVDFIFPADYREGMELDRTVRDILRKMTITDRLLEVNNRQLRSIGGDVLPNQVGLF